MIKKEGGTMDRDTIFLYVIAVMPFAVGRVEGQELRDADLGGLLQQPLETVGAFRRRDGQSQRIGHFFELLFHADDPHRTAFGIVVGDLAAK